MMSERNTPALSAASALASLSKGPRLERTVRSDSIQPNLPRNRNSKKQKPLTFPQKLMQVLSIEEYSDIIVWLPHGKSFAIVSPREFVSEILPNFFKRAKYSSFTRKLHRWGFQRRLRGEEAGSYYHKLFQRDDEELCLKMSMSMNARDSTEDLRNSEVASGDSSASYDAGVNNVGNDLNQQLQRGKNKYFHQASYPVPLLPAVQQPRPSEIDVLKSIQHRPLPLQATVPVLDRNPSRVNMDAGQRALEQLLLARSLRLRYQTAVYSRILMNPMQSYVGSDILPSVQSGALSTNVPNQTPGLYVTHSQALVQNQGQKITTGRYDVGTLSVLSMTPPSA
uniref:HSF-type DNA-binding domain-containing protein n=1 Tax=Helicotheca tamesis TaxID=374047 RepID=A0A7S2MZV7_9STRA